MKLVQRNREVIRYEYDRLFYYLISLLFTTVFIVCAASLFTDRILTCRYINADSVQCEIVSSKPYFPVYRSGVRRIDHPQQAKVNSRAGKIIYYDVEISNQNEKLIFPAYANKAWATNIAQEINDYLKKDRSEPLVFKYITSKDFNKLAILYLCWTIYSLCTPTNISCEVNNQGEIAIAKSYCGLIRRSQFSTAQLQEIGKQKHGKKSFSVYLKTKQNRKTIIGSGLTAKTAQEVIDRLNQFIYHLR